MKLYSCDFEGCTATTEKLGSGWERIDWIPRRWLWLMFALPALGNLLCFTGALVDHGYYLCPEHAKRIKGLMQSGG